MQKNILIFFCLLFCACSEKKTENIPDHILPIQKMAAVMIDIHLLEASISLNATSVDKFTIGSSTPGFEVLKKNNITKKQYDESFDYYTQHPALLNEVYQLALNDLSKMQAEVMNKN